MLKVARAFQLFRPAGKLGWTHYVLLSAVPNEHERQYYLDRATRNRWTRLELRSQIKARAHLHPPEPKAERLSPRRGRLYTYRILEVTDKAVRVDLGMHHEATIESSRLNGEDKFPQERFSENEHAVIVTKNESSYTLTEGTESRLYTYACTV